MRRFRLLQVSSDDLTQQIDELVNIQTPTHEQLQRIKNTFGPLQREDRLLLAKHEIETHMHTKIKDLSPRTLKKITKNYEYHQFDRDSVDINGKDLLEFSQKMVLNHKRTCIDGLHEELTRNHWLRVNIGLNILKLIPKYKGHKSNDTQEFTELPINDIFDYIGSRWGDVKVAYGMFISGSFEKYRGKRDTSKCRIKSINIFLRSTGRRIKKRTLAGNTTKGIPLYTVVRLVKNWGV